MQAPLCLDSAPAHHALDNESAPSALLYLPVAPVFPVLSSSSHAAPASLSPCCLQQMINTAAPEKGYQVNYIKWRALVQKAADDWATKDAAAAKDWSAKKTAGKAGGITTLPHWEKNDPRERRRLALEEGRRVVNGVFWSSKDRDAVRGDQAKAALEWLKKKTDARAKAVAAAPKPPGYIDCQWKPNAGMEVKVSQPRLLHRYTSRSSRCRTSSVAPARRDATSCNFMNFLCVLWLADAASSHWR